MTCDYSVIQIISPAIVQTHKVSLAGKVHEQNYNAPRCNDKPRTVLSTQEIIVGLKRQGQIYFPTDRYLRYAGERERVS